MIVAAGLTPAFQQIFVFDSYRPGQVNRAREAHLLASGKVLNAGLALHFLGGPSLTLAMIGGATGDSIAKEFSSLGIRHRWVRTQSATRMCATVLDAATGVATELVENARAVPAEALEEFLRVFGEEAKAARVVLLSGSLPAGTPKTYYRDLARLSPAPLILDASGPELIEALPLRPFCVKPNRDELGRTLGRELHTDDDLKAAISEVHFLGAQWVLVSQGARALWASGPEGILQFIPATVPVVNPIGSGDCLAAGVAWGIGRGMTMPEAVRFGMAAAAENATMLLPARLDRESVIRRAQEIEVGAIA